jgi:hypothetical protein
MKRQGSTELPRFAVGALAIAGASAANAATVQITFTGSYISTTGGNQLVTDFGGDGIPDFGGTVVNSFSVWVEGQLGVLGYAVGFTAPSSNAKFAYAYAGAFGDGGGGGGARQLPRGAWPRCVSVTRISAAAVRRRDGWISQLLRFIPGRRESPCTA